MKKIAGTSNFEDNFFCLIMKLLPCTVKPCSANKNLYLAPIKIQDEQIFEHTIHAVSPREYALRDSSF